MNPIDALLDSIEFTPTGNLPDDSGLLYATHSGIFDMAGLKLRVYRLNNGKAVVNADDMSAALGDFLGESK